MNKCIQFRYVIIVLVSLLFTGCTRASKSAPPEPPPSEFTDVCGNPSCPDEVAIIDVLHVAFGDFMIIDPPVIAAPTTIPPIGKTIIHRPIFTTDHRFALVGMVFRSPTDTLCVKMVNLLELRGTAWYIKTSTYNHEWRNCNQP